MKTLFPLVTTDIALFTLMNFQLRVLLVKRGNDPSPGAWALPGGVLQPDLDRSLEDSTRRVLAQKINVEIPHLAQVATISGADRDPRGWSISTLYYALLPSDQIDATIGDAIDEVAWSDPENYPHQLAFDHALLLKMALSTLRWKVAHGALPLHQLPEKFTLTDLQKACEAITGGRLDKAAFRRQLKDNLALQMVLGEFVRGPQRPAQLYRMASGFQF